MAGSRGNELTTADAWRTLRAMRTALCFLGLSTLLPAEPVPITVRPHITRSIEGIAEVERTRYFALSEPGPSLERVLRGPERLAHVTDELDVRLGRNLGPLGAVIRTRRIDEDPERPGFADRDQTIQRLQERARRQPPAPAWRAHFGTNADVAAHGRQSDFPKFMGAFETEFSRKAHHRIPIPQNYKSAAEFSALVLRHGYDDWSRPAFYEPFNEPHWSFITEKHFADWHLETKQRVHELCPDVQVGGPCLSIPYFYQNGYGSFNTLREFMDHTEGKMDFYSFHVYDFYQSPEAGRNLTRITSGLPLEGMLDLVEGYSVNHFGKPSSLVISEHGGYVLKDEEKPASYDGEHLAREVDAASRAAGGDDFASEIRRRSIIQWIHVSSILSQTLTFLDHPHTLKKAVPFILANTESWGPHYYASLYTPENYKRGADLHEGFLANYYRFFAGVDGRRVVADSPDPDLQTRAFVDGNTVYTIINNLSTRKHTVVLDGVGAPGTTHRMRRLLRDSEFIPSYEEAGVDSIQRFELTGREALLIESILPESVVEKERIEERALHGKQMLLNVAPGKQVSIDLKTPAADEILNAILRVNFDREPGSDYQLTVRLNGSPLNVPMADAAERYDEKLGGYSTTKMVPVPASLLKESNTIALSFPDGKPGVIGSATIRARYSTRE